MSGQITALSEILQYGLAVVLLLLALLSAQLVAVSLFRLFWPERRPRAPQLPDEALPDVVVQLPVRDEGDLALRVASAAMAMDWPAGKMTVQVLDDGNPDRHEALKAQVLALAPAGVKLEVLRRGARTGFKAGNLAFGLKHCEAPFVAVFDADFVPPADFLRRTVPVLVADSGLCFVQARWGHANRNLNWLTRAQGMLLDAHFAVEQEGRFRAGLPISFNGTAGVWRRAAIEDAGGWAGDTLTEDLDLSMRCTLKGWRAAYLKDLEVPAELPETAAAWRAQQARWTKGHAQCVRKLLPMIWKSRLSFTFKLAMSFQMSQFAFYTLAFVSAAISLTLMYIGAVYLQSVGVLGLFVTAFGLSVSFGYIYLGQKLLGRHRAIGLHRSLLLAIVFPSGLILANTRAALEAFLNRPMEFTRTLRAGERYVGGWRGAPELLVGVFLPAFAFAEQAWSAPFFAIAVAGLVSIGAMGFSGGVQSPSRQIASPRVRSGE
jgi:cellulose synthase/poly-beta-1,6-N-acetylglucosamine synthase-like glycosyltransferase